MSYSVSTPSAHNGFDKGAAVTRSLLGWGVVAGPFYLITGLAQALTRDGFKLSEHPLSLLMRGEFGWIQVANLALTGLMVLAAAVGFARVMHKRNVAVPLGVYGVCLLVSAAFPPDPVDGFPPGSQAPDTFSTSGLVHFGAGAVGFVALAVAAVLAGRWFSSQRQSGTARMSYVAAVVIGAGFVGGAALSSNAAGVAVLWLVVVVGFAWLLIASVRAYRIAPHPDCP
jgi:hypothetical protein